MPAHVERGIRHADDRGVLAAVRADRPQLEPLQAVDAAVAARQVRRRAQPRLVAGGTDRPEVHRLAHARVNLATKKPSVRSRCGSVSRVRGMVGCFQTGCTVARSSAEKSGWAARKSSTTRSFSAGEIVHVEYTRVPPQRTAPAPPAS